MPHPILLGFRALILALLIAKTSAQEFRALWADTFHAGLRNGTETSAVITAARAANCNAVVVEVRRRGDAFYRNGLEPVATDVAANFDPLADLIQKGHSGSPRIEIHAWFVTFNIWNKQSDPPSQPNHPFNLHPEWLTQNNSGAQWDGGNYQFDPGHPSVQQHTYSVLMDVLNRYDVDGLHFDYVRYSENGSTAGNQPWGYNPVVVDRYKRLTGTTSTPAPNNAAWLQWRRDQVTALVRKVYLNAWATKPNVRISASLIPWGTPPANLNLSAWQSTEAYARVLQDWRAWMEEGILDLACPMVYRTDNSGVDGWADFTKDRQYNRAGAVGLGWYLNSISNTITQIGVVRQSSPNGKSAAGILGYSYAVPNKDGDSQATSWAQLVAGPYSSPVTVPPMPWKTNATKGHLMGSLIDSATLAPLDGSTVTLTGPSNRTLVADGTGFFGSVDLPVGIYTLTFTAPGYRPISRSVQVAGATVAQPSFTVERLPFVITNYAPNFAAGTVALTWNSLPGKTYRIEQSENLSQWTTAASGVLSGGGSTSFTWPVPAAWLTNGFVRISED